MAGDFLRYQRSNLRTSAGEILTKAVLKGFPADVRRLFSQIVADFGVQF
jgi:hypothetical protein